MPAERATLVMALTLLSACGPVEPGRDAAPAEEISAPAGPVAERVIAREIARIDSAAAAVDSIFQPLPLLRPAEEESLRAFGNVQQLSRARTLGVGRGHAPDRLEALLGEGRLVRLTDTEHWVVRDMDYSQPLAVPGVAVLLAEIGGRFQARLAALGAPPYRVEVSSALRAASDQEALRRVNPNAALGESTHEYGTTVDVLYSAFAAPLRPLVEIDVAGAAWAEPYLRRYAEIAAERVAGRRALELKAILGQVLLEMQAQGWVMVTLERQQPVYHMTLAREP
jgi:hypothetical protein